MYAYIYMNNKVSVPTKKEIIDWDRFRNMLRLKREDKSMKSIAEHLGLHYTQYSGYEAGQRPGVETFFMLCLEYLKMDPSEFITKKDD